MPQDELPKQSKLGSPVTRAGSRQLPHPAPWRPSTRLCALLNDLRELRTKVEDVAGRMQQHMPAAWDTAKLTELGLGQSFTACQVSLRSVCKTHRRRLADVSTHMHRCLTPCILDQLNFITGQL